jgi:hypothetical protein
MAFTRSIGGELLNDRTWPISPKATPPNQRTVADAKRVGLSHSRSRGAHDREHPEFAQRSAGAPKQRRANLAVSQSGAAFGYVSEAVAGALKKK